MLTFDQWASLGGVATAVLVAVAGLIKVVTDMVTAFRRRDTKPAPEVGIPASPPPGDDIDYRAYEDMRKDRDYWRDLYNARRDTVDEDTEPLT